MSKNIKPDELGAALEKELTIYSEEVNEGLRQVTETSMKKLVKLTKASAPVGKRGSFNKNITADYKGTRGKSRKVSATWYVRAPDYRLTHLIVHGHDKKDVGRTRANPFLVNAVNQVLPEYEQAVQEVLKND
jgi:hypothetical protein